MFSIEREKRLKSRNSEEGLNFLTALVWTQRRYDPVGEWPNTGLGDLESNI